MENNNTTTTVKAVKTKRGKKLAKAVTAFTVGAALLFGGNTFAIWEGSQSIGQQQTITAGELSIDRAKSAGSWTLNGTPLPDSELSGVKLVPGDTVAYAGTEAPRVVGDTLTGWMYFQGTEAVQNALAGASGATMDWSVAGKQEAKKLTSADHLVDQPVAFSVSLDAGSDNTSQALTVDLSGVQIAVSMLNPSSTTPPPPVDGEDPSALWVINDPTVRAAVVKRLGVQDASQLKISDKPLVEGLVFLEMPGDAALSELADMPALAHVGFFGRTGELTGAQMSDLAKASKVKSLHFSNPLGGTSLGELAKMASLKDVRLRGEMSSAQIASLAEAAQVEVLSFSDAPAGMDFSDLRKMTSLREVTLMAEELDATHLSSLAKADQVESLTIDSWSRSDLDLSILSPMKLASLNARHSFPSLTGVEQLTSLKILEAADAEVEDLSMLENLTGLETVKIDSFSDLTDISAISNLDRLKTLKISGASSLHDISAIPGHAGLKTLSISEAEALTNLAPLAGAGITELTLVGTGASDFSFLSSLSSLQDLYVLQESFTSLEPLRGAKNLAKINLHMSTPVTSLEPLRGMTQLEWLSVGSAALNDGTPLASLTGLTYLSLIGTNISDLSSVSSLTGLKDLSVGKKTTDLAPLAGMTSLKSLNLRDAVGITNLEPLRGLTGITWLDTRGTSVTDFSPVEGFSNVFKD